MSRKTKHQLQLEIDQLKEKSSRLEKRIEALESRKLTSIDSANIDSLYMAIVTTSGKRPAHKIFRNKKAFKAAVRMLKNGKTYSEVAASLLKVGHRVSSSSIGRFWKFIKKEIYIHE